MPEYRRRLPHIHPGDVHLFITSRLHGSMPAKPGPIIYPTPGRAFAAQDRILDQRSSGPLWLKDHRIGDLVSQAFLIGETERNFYRLAAWVVMPSRVHMLIRPLVPVSTTMRWLKGSTARTANRILDRTGKPFWQDESWDHCLRTPRQIDRVAAYIENNPVSPGLVSVAQDWLWSSAGWQAKLPAPQPSQNNQFAIAIA